MSFRRSLYLVPAMVLALASCELFESKTAKLWTDRPEFSFYVEIFNTMQSRYKVELVYSEAPAEKLRDAQAYPDIVVGSWLKSASTRNLFKPLDYFFEDLLISEKSFYSRLLSLGNIEGKQYLFPVSFNVPALIFSKENASLIGKPFILTLEEIKGLGKAYNIVAKGVYSRMGFSPRWNDEFLFVTAALHGASFREGTPLAWDGQALDKAIRFIRQWTSDANTDISSEDDFAFKYLYDPAPKMAASGRILFAYMNSADLFTIPEERRATLDFRWIAKDSQIPMVEGSTYLGIFKGGRAKSAADAFVRWFYKEETQHQLLDASKATRLNETLFGIANGFSALKTVNEQIYPRFYPNLLGHVPPEDYLTPPNILPRDWVVVKERVILPYLHDRARLVDSGLPLDKRLDDWYRINPRR